MQKKNVCTTSRNGGVSCCANCGGAAFAYSTPAVMQVSYQVGMSGAPMTLAAPQSHLRAYHAEQAQELEYTDALADLADLPHALRSNNHLAGAAISHIDSSKTHSNNFSRKRQSCR